MEKTFLHSKLWRYEYNETKTGVVIFGETGPQHFVQKHKRSWTLREKVVEEEKVSIRIWEFSKIMRVLSSLILTRPLRNEEES